MSRGREVGRRRSAAEFTEALALNAQTFLDQADACRRGGSFLRFDQGHALRKVRAFGFFRLCKAMRARVPAVAACIGDAQR